MIDKNNPKFAYFLFSFWENLIIFVSRRSELLHRPLFWRKHPRPPQTKISAGRWEQLNRQGSLNDIHTDTRPPQTNIILWRPELLHRLCSWSPNLPIHSSHSLLSSLILSFTLILTCSLSQHAIHQNAHACAQAHARTCPWEFAPQANLSSKVSSSVWSTSFSLFSSRPCIIHLSQEWSTRVSNSSSNSCIVSWEIQRHGTLDVSGIDGRFRRFGGFDEQILQIPFLTWGSHKICGFYHRNKSIAWSVHNQPDGFWTVWSRPLLHTCLQLSLLFCGTHAGHNNTSLPRGLAMRSEWTKVGNHVGHSPEQNDITDAGKTIRRKASTNDGLSQPARASRLLALDLH